MTAPTFKEDSQTTTVHAASKRNGPETGFTTDKSGVTSEWSAQWFRYRGKEQSLFLRPLHRSNLVRALPYVVLALLLLATDYYSLNYLRGIEKRESWHDQLITDIRTDLNEQGSTLGGLGESFGEVANTTVSLQRKLDQINRQLTVGQKAARQLAERITHLEEGQRLPVLSGKPYSPLNGKKEPRTDTQGEEEYHIDRTISPVANAVIHRALGSVDYWLLKRHDNSVASRVIPYGISESGIFIHSLDDGRNYLLLANGDWRVF